MTAKKWNRKLDSIERIIKRQLVKTYIYNDSAVKSMARQLQQIELDRVTGWTLESVDRYYG